MSELPGMPLRSTAAPRRTTGTGRAASPVTGRASTSLPPRTAPRRAGRKAPVELRPLRLAALALLLVAAALFVSPLRAFFAAQDSYFGQVAAVSQLQAANRALHGQIIDMHSAAYIERQAREQWQLVPAGLQAFIVKGLPTSAPSPASNSPLAATPTRPSLEARLSDLWRTLRE
jgi:cell division protein FtsB